MKTVKNMLLIIGVGVLSSCSSDLNVRTYDLNVRGASNTSSNITQPNNTKTSKINKTSKKSIKFAPLLRFDVSKYIIEVAKEKTNDWVSRKSLIPLVSILEPTKKQDTGVYPKIIKNEFETTTSFEQKVSDQVQLKKDKMQFLELEYQKELEQYKKIVKEYELNIQEEKNQRLSIKKTVYTDYVIESIESILGVPAIKNLTYNADLSVFSATLYSKLTNFRKDILINVPIGIAPEFKKNSAYLLPDVEFQINANDDSIFIFKIDVVFRGNIYPAKVINQKAFSLR
ncbi:hypothetical protein SPBRAN_825 [uncultured Candidatus Thioglobus sp.]|nr:hypothetical protein SPBRAN_825 [uncultured Candidatus Thioglobus sp.]